MNKKLLTEYFSFSRKERNAVILLVLLIVVIFVIPYFFPRSDKKLDADIAAAIDEYNKHETVSKPEGEKEIQNHGPYEVNERRLEPKLFFFDPNSLSANGWRGLGVKPRTIETIEKYRSKGGSFRQPEDLRKIFGLSPALAEQLMPYVKIEGREKAAERSLFVNKDPPLPIERKRLMAVVDINLADSVALEALNGIGPTLAARIVKFRDKLGGFYQLSQLGEVYGLQDSIFQQLKPHISISEIKLKKLNINAADLSELSAHPYLGRKLANMIIQYRVQHGAFSSVDDLSEIPVFTSELMKRLKPYLAVEE